MFLILDLRFERSLYLIDESLNKSVWRDAQGRRDFLKW